MKQINCLLKTGIDKIVIITGNSVMQNLFKGGNMLELYQIGACPYCKKVRQKLSELNLDYICRNVSHGTKKREILMILGGKDQVPFLVDYDKEILMYESDAIIEYLEKTYGS